MWENLRGQNLATAVAFVAGTGFTLFGYDQGLYSGLLTNTYFEQQFPQTVYNDQTNRNGDKIQAITVAIYEIGCLMGALSCLWVGDALGRKKTIVWGSVIMIIGALLQTTAYSLPQLIVARIVTGVGNGLNTATIPVYQSEVSDANKRGFLILISGSLITFGIMVSYWVGFGCSFIKSSAAWRVPIALQIVFALLLFLIIPLVETPRWLVKKGRIEEARQVIARLEDISEDDPHVEKTIKAIQDGLLASGEEGLNIKVMIQGGKSQNFRRALLAIWIQAMQQIGGINLITYYATVVYEDSIGLTPFQARLVAACNGTEYFLASLIPLKLIDTVGRRKLMMWTAVLQCLTMVVLCGCTSTKAKAPNGVAAAFLFLFNTWFAIGWLGMTWLYPPEVTSLQVRAASSALATCSNWIFNFMVVMVTPPAFKNINNYTYLVFGLLNLSFLPTVWAFYPETKGRSLEEMDLIFAKAYEDKRNPVWVANEWDKYGIEAGGPEAHRLLADVEAERRALAAATGTGKMEKSGEHQAEEGTGTGSGTARSVRSDEGAENK